MPSGAVMGGASEIGEAKVSDVTVEVEVAQAEHKLIAMFGMILRRAH